MSVDMYDIANIAEKKHTSWNILLVGENEQQRFLHFSVVDNSVQLLSCLVYAGLVAGVDHEDQPLSTYFLMSANRSRSAISVPITMDSVVVQTMNKQEQCHSPLK
jgi:hypothetical protein